MELSISYGVDTKLETKTPNKSGDKFLPLKQKLITKKTMTKSNKSNNKGFAKCQPEDHPLAQQYNKRMEECGGDFLEYQRRYNRHTLRISLTDEQVGKELWGDYEVTFFNEDNAINHLGFLGDLLEFMTKEENRNWGLGLQDEGLVKRYTDFITEKVLPHSQKNKSEIA